jgi:hypothetical protein
MKVNIIYAFSMLLLVACSSTKGITISASPPSPVSHEQWDALLKKHVDNNGNVNYKGFVADSVKLNDYLDLLSKNPANESWGKDERLAYWINAYNAFTVKLIVSGYPVKSIKELGGSIYKVNTPWDIKFIKIGDEKYDLNNIEHGIIRKKFNEPRIHFAVNCASESCPRLRNEAYTADKLERQLTDQAKYFINNPKKNDLSSSTQPKLSKIFKWFSGDFKKGDKSVIDFINRYASKKLDAKAKPEYLDYGWNLNE